MLFKRIIFISLLLILFSALPCRFSLASSPIKTIPTYKTVPDLGNLSEMDNIFDLSTRQFKTDYEKEEYEFYIYTLSQRLLSIKNILSVRKVSREIGKYLKIEGDTLTSLPDSLLSNFSRDRFPDLYNQISSIQNGNFTFDNGKMDRITQTLGQKAVEMLGLEQKIFEKEILNKAEIEQKYKAKVPGLMIPTGVSGFATIYRTMELPGYNRNIGKLDSEISEYKNLLDDASNRLFLYFPFYRDNFFKTAYNSIASSVKPSFLFYELLIATIFFDERPDFSLETPEEFAKWLHSGITNPGEYQKFSEFFSRTKEVRDSIRNQAMLPASIFNGVKYAFRKVIRESIKLQNNSISFFSGSQFVLKKSDLINCHANPSQKYTSLPIEFAFLSEFAGLKEQFTKEYADTGIISEDRANVLNHKLELAYEDELKDNNRGWVVTLRVVELCAAILIPGGWIPLAIIAGGELINAGTAWQVSSKTGKEFTSLLNLYDAENFDSEYSETASLSVKNYQDILERKDAYQSEAISATAFIPANVGLFYLVSNLARFMVAGKPIESLSKIIKPLTIAPKLARASIVLASAGLIVGLQIKDAVSFEKQDFELIADSTQAEKFIANSSSRENLVTKLKGALQLAEFSVQNSRVDDLGLLQLLSSLQNSALNSQDSPVRLYDNGSTRISSGDSSVEKIFLNYKFASASDTTAENILFEMAYYYYLSETSSLLLEKAKVDDQNFKELFSSVTGKEIKLDKLEKIKTDNLELEKSLEKSIKLGLFEGAEKFAKGMGGIKNPNRKYLGISMGTN